MEYELIEEQELLDTDILEIKFEPVLFITMSMETYQGQN